MHLFLTHMLRKLISYFFTFLIITAVLYGMVMLTSVEDRATLYYPANMDRMTEKQFADLTERIIVKYHLRDPYPVQYFLWLQSLVNGGWGYSPTLRAEVLPTILRLTPATAELTLISTLLFLPIGLFSGIRSGSKRNSLRDRSFRMIAYVATSIPPFLMAILLMIIFYIELYWFQPGRLSPGFEAVISESSYRSFTGLITLDGLLNHRPDISLDALRHLAMPAITLSFPLWAIVGRVTRTSMIDELGQDYIVAARSHGLSERRVLWGHALRNVISPVISTSVLSAASIMTNTFIVEIIFNYPGISSVARKSLSGVPDAPASLGFAVYSIIIVIILMAALDILQALIDPRIYQAGRDA
ncbi:MAG: ABC transporter permease [Anaerolineaceae bacterium]